MQLKVQLLICKNYYTSIKSLWHICVSLQLNIVEYAVSFKPFGSIWKAHPF